jgi:hypothetical protein
MNGCKRRTMQLGYLVQGAHLIQEVAQNTKKIVREEGEGLLCVQQEDKTVNGKEKGRELSVLSAARAFMDSAFQSISVVSNVPMEEDV